MRDPQRFWETTTTSSRAERQYSLRENIAAFTCQSSRRTGTAGRAWQALVARMCIEWYLAGVCEEVLRQESRDERSNEEIPRLIQAGEILHS